MRGRAYFVTGTDTDVGKTWVTSRIATLLTAHGIRVAALKAAESGCRWEGDALVAADDAALFEAAGRWQPERCRYRFHPAVAPGVAADDLDVEIDFDRIAEQVETLCDEAEIALVEGAGGWLVPMGQGRTIEDLARRLAAPVIVVGRGKLGTINHVALTVRAVRSAGLEVAAVILSIRPDDDLDLVRRNAREIDALVGGECWLMDGSEADQVVSTMIARVRSPSS